MDVTSTAGTTFDSAAGLASRRCPEGSGSTTLHLNAVNSKHTRLSVALKQPARIATIAIGKCGETNHRCAGDSCAEWQVDDDTDLKPISTSVSSSDLPALSDVRRTPKLSARNQDNANDIDNHNQCDSKRSSKRQANLAGVSDVSRAVCRRRFDLVGSTLESPLTRCVPRRESGVRSSTGRYRGGVHRCDPIQCGEGDRVCGNQHSPNGSTTTPPLLRCSQPQSHSQHPSQSQGQGQREGAHGFLKASPEATCQACSKGEALAHDVNKCEDVCEEAPQRACRLQQICTRKCDKVASPCKNHLKCRKLAGVKASSPQAAALLELATVGIEEVSALSAVEKSAMDRWKWVGAQLRAESSQLGKLKTKSSGQGAGRRLLVQDPPHVRESMLVVHTVLSNDPLLCASQKGKALTFVGVTCGDRLQYIAWKAFLDLNGERKNVNKLCGLPTSTPELSEFLGKCGQSPALVNLPHRVCEVGEAASSGCLQQQHLVSDCKVGCTSPIKERTVCKNTCARKRTCKVGACKKKGRVCKVDTHRVCRDEAPSTLLIAPSCRDAAFGRCLWRKCTGGGGMGKGPDKKSSFWTGSPRWRTGGAVASPKACLS